MIGGILNFIMGLFGGKKKEEVKKLDEAIKDAINCVNGR